MHLDSVRADKLRQDLPQWIVGDIQGCHTPLHELVAQNSGQLFCVGDLVNRGPDSLATLRLMREGGHTSLLGNHDLYLLVCSVGALQPKPGDTISQILNAPDHDELLNWLRLRPMAQMVDGHLLVHAGVVPQWSAQDTLECAAEVEAALRSPQWQEFLRNLWGNVPLQWNDHLRGWDRLRCIVNILTRIRYVRADGTMDLLTKESTGGVPAGYMPWFDVPGRRTADTTVVFGHWSTMGLINRPNLVGLDTGFVWGGKLTAVQLYADWTQRRFVSVAGLGRADAAAIT
ncbi:MAG: symmetrical bis(5'-nucleosyl)-tetraphosphatase [Burkholderiaceae bacterium]